MQSTALAKSLPVFNRIDYPIVMIFRRVLLALLLLTPVILSAQSIEADIRARLVNKPLYLRGFWREDNLHFDGSGKLIGNSKQVSFTLSGVDVTNVHLKSDMVILDARRAGLELKNPVPKRVTLQVGDFGSTKDEKMHLVIDLPPGGDFGSALDNIFANDLISLTPSLPWYWQPYAVKTFLPTSVPPTAAPVPPTVRKVGGAVKPPKLLKSAEPVFSDAARKLKYQSTILIGLIAEADGTASHLSLVKPAGLGLDEQALYAVQQYTFQPATENGNAVRVSLNVEVKFEIY